MIEHWRLTEYDFWAGEYKDENGKAKFERAICPLCRSDARATLVRTRVGLEPLYCCSNCSYCFGVKYDIPRPRKKE